MKKVLELARELVKELEKIENTEEKVELSTLSPGDVIKGKENDYIVLDQMDGQTMIISKGIMLESVKFDSHSTDYGNSSLKKKIDSELLPIFAGDFGAENIIESDLDLTTVDNQQPYENVECKVRPITFDEARKYNDLLVDEKLNDWSWTCTPWSTKERGYSSVAVVCPSGFIYWYFGGSNIGVRPVCILKSNIFVSKGE